MRVTKERFLRLTSDALCTFSKEFFQTHLCLKAML